MKISISEPLPFTHDEGTQTHESPPAGNEKREEATLKARGAIRGCAVRRRGRGGEMKAWDGSLPLPTSCRRPESTNTRRAAVALHSLIPESAGHVGEVSVGGRGERSPRKPPVE